MTVMQVRLAQIDRVEPTMENLRDAALQWKTQELKDRLRSKRAAVGRP